MPDDLQDVLQDLTNEQAELRDMIERERTYKPSKFKGQKSGSDFTTTELPHHGDYGARTDTSEIQFNIDGTIFVFASTTASGSYAPSPHNLDSSHHDGTLSNAQAPQFLLLDGTRAMTAALDMGTFAITNVGTVDGLDVSAHDHGAAGGAGVDHANLTGVLADQHHNSFIGLEDNAGTAVSPAADDRIQFTDDGVINADASGATIALSIDQGALDHGQLGGLGDDDHPQYTAHAQNETITGLWTYDREIVMAEIASPTAPATGYAKFYAFDLAGVTTIRAMDADGRYWSLNQDMFDVVRNETGGTLTAGTVVYAAGDTGTHTTVAPALASDPARMPAIGILVEDIADLAYGAMMIGGEIHNIDTSAFAVGDELYVSASSAGDLTATKPTHPNIAQHVLHVHASGVGNGAAAVVIHEQERVEDGTRSRSWRFGDETANNIYLHFDDGTDRSIYWDDGNGRFQVTEATWVNGTFRQTDPTYGHYFELVGKQIRFNTDSADAGGDPGMFWRYDDTTWIGYVNWDDDLANGLEIGVYSGVPGPEQVTIDNLLLLRGDLRFDSAHDITSAAGNIGVRPAGDLELEPGGYQVRVLEDVTLQSDHYVSQVTGFGITYDGAGDFRYLYADELHAKAFIADLEQALAGGQIISKSVAVLADPFTTATSTSLEIQETDTVNDYFVVKGDRRGLFPGGSTFTI